MKALILLLVLVQSKEEIPGYSKAVTMFPARGSGTPGLIIGFHGAGGSGPQMSRQFDVAGITGAGYILACPSSLQGSWRGNTQTKQKDAKYIRAIVDHFLKKYRVHPDKIHFIGFSMGAVISAQILSNPTFDMLQGIRIRSLCAHSGALNGEFTAQAARSKETSVWCLNGSRDRGHAPGNRNMHDMFEKGGYETKYTTAQGKGHTFPLVSMKELIAWWKELDKDAGKGPPGEGELKEAEKLLKRKKYGEAWAIFSRFEENPRAVEGRAKIEKAARTLLDKAKKGSRSKRKRIYRDVIRKFKGTPWATEAEESLLQLT